MTTILGSFTYFEEFEGKAIPLFKVNMRVFNLLKEFILNDLSTLYMTQNL
ncbi:hypothetical protein [Aliarcobacter lanthieri]|nr:hypothetical protein [Aliarcobacter lanthieri]